MINLLPKFEANRDITRTSNNFFNLASLFSVIVSVFLLGFVVEFVSGFFLLLCIPPCLHVLAWFIDHWFGIALGNARHYFTPRGQHGVETPKRFKKEEDRNFVEKLHK